MNLSITIIPNYDMNYYGMANLNKNPPILVGSIDDIEIECGTQQEVKIPEIIDPNGDQVNRPKFILGEARQIVKITPTSIIINPTINKCIDQKLFKVSIVLTDINLIPRQNIIEFKITTFVKSTSNPILINKRNRTAIPKKIINIDMISEDFTATIKDIDERGNVIVRFSESLRIPNDYLQFDEDFLLISVIPNVQSEQQLDKNIKSWNMTNFSEREIILAINFSHPDHISTRAVSIHFSNCFIVRERQTEYSVSREWKLHFRFKLKDFANQLYNS
ncbi:hypothetical protein FGO68_gene10859 [Halteria grandinella]|uniref:Uncharacterized protein n=1 Tax=Halteria grandinella TaxID=5974 RepID=A0A8J8T8T6_HALGN|nr:hypothetical protein FGO68_gene10859 [Halteria grandinella]